MYSYDEMRPKLFTDEGQRDFLKVRDNAARLFSESGAARQTEMTSCISGDSYFKCACVDRLIELGEISEVSYANRIQDRIFVKG